MDKPLAIKMAPKSIKDIIGQEHLVGKDKILYNLVKNNKLFSIILYGNPGIGKTSIANALVNDLDIKYKFLNAVESNKKDFENAINEAKIYDGLVLIVDEIHRMNKDKQDILLPVVESGLIILIGLTTTNPYHTINPAIRSRCQVLRLEPLKKEDILKGLDKAIDKGYLKDIKITGEAKNIIANMSKYDLRYAYNLLEIAYYMDSKHNVTIDTLKNINNNAIMYTDKNETSHHDNMSGLQKSIRGSDVDAALFYLALMIESGDLDSIYRRLSVIMYEDIALANPALGPKLNAAIDACNLVGLPEAKLILSPIVIEMALSPKSNSSYLAISKGIEDVKTKNYGNIPDIIKSPYKGYLYPHSYKNAIVKQEYLPKSLIGTKYYIPKNSSKYEEALKIQKEKIEKLKNS